ncbi:bifunctional phosphoribosyl-AMP cyclohydrolase/phosphoribosyl-ATP diphosphatase HisIE [Candidatus Micrarchaeota archaeon]|nr:bifunctional phosphoribosyl-AMP cyclohydrolase/phosphoribosyl-ATP diphosphatase HisIE [Candidatus Micrarchaeota archaeon]
MKLFPVIVQDSRTKDVLMLAYANAEALARTKKTKAAWFYSCSRKKLWKKGETSGNTMKVNRVLWDCDRDALLYMAEPKGVACHTGKQTCFGKREFSLESLFQVLEQRKKKPARNSYTAKLLRDRALLDEKILEEARELTEAKTKQELAWEAADVFYFTLVKLVEKGVSLEDVVRELEKRR